MATSQINHISVVLLGLTLMPAVLLAQTQGGSGGTNSGKDNNPANPANWELVSSVTGTVSYVSYPFLSTSPTSGSYSLASPPNPRIIGIAAWSTYTGTWEMSGTSNFRWKWIGIGASPVNVRVLNGASSTGKFTGLHTFSHNLTNIDNITEMNDTANEGKFGGGFRNVGADSLFQIGYTQSSTVNASPTGTNGSGQFAWGASSELAELSTAIRPQDGATYHKLGNGPNKEVNTGDGYSDWVMDTVAQAPDIAVTVNLVNILTGPWHKPTATFSWTPHSNFQEYLEQKVLTLPSYSPANWSNLSNGPDEKTVTVTVKDVESDDQPERTATIRIRIHNPDENWRKVLYSDGTPHESIYEKSPDHIELESGSPASVNSYDEAKIKFKGYFSYPLVKHMNDAINSKMPLLNALLEYSPAKFKKIMDAASIAQAQILQPESGTGPHEASYAGQWTNPHSTFDPVGQPYEYYTMTASQAYYFKMTNWKSDSYDQTGYTGVNGGFTDLYNGGGFTYGIYTGGGSNGSGGNGSGSGSGSTPPGGGSSGGGL